MAKFKSKQKFHRGDICRVPGGWSQIVHKNGEVLIIGSYNDEYGGRNYTSYSFMPLSPKRVATNQCAWLEVEELELVIKNWPKAQYTIQKFNERHGEEY